MRAYLRSFNADTRRWLEELRAERSWVAIGLVVLFLPLIFLCDLVVYLGDVVGPE